MLAERLKPGDEIRVIAPSRSMALIKGEQLQIAQERLNQLGFTVTYGKNAEIHDEFFSTSIEERIEDLHDAFTNPNVKGILTVIGGYNANQLLNYIDFGIIKNNPKIFCGFSDITALQGAIYKKTGLITYSGPHFSSFGVKHGFEYTLDSFINAVTNDAPYEILASPHWSDDPWYLDQEDRHFIKNNGYSVIQEGNAEGRLIGGNLCTLNLLHLPDAQGIKGILIGRFQKNSQVTEEALRKIIDSKKELHGLPVIADVNFGHVQPYATIPIGGRAAIKAQGFESEIWIEQK